MTSSSITQRGDFVSVAQLSTYRLIAMLLTAISCSRGMPNEPDLPYASAQTACGPTDGPAVLVRLSTQPLAERSASPALNAFIWLSIDEMKRMNWGAGGREVDGQASFTTGDGALVPQKRSSVRVIRVSNDLTIEGRVVIVFSDNTRLDKYFVAPWARVSGFPCG
jgi:hypothetical protein